MPRSRAAYPSPGATAVTLRDVARAAGVSTASVSRALAGETGVSAELQARIMAATARLGYHANLAARALASRRSGLVAVVARTLADPLIAGVVEALESRLSAAGYGTLLATNTGLSDRLMEATQALLGRGAEAFVFVGAGPLPAEIALMDARRLPWACVSDGPAAGPLLIDPGRRRGGALAARYLLDLGHRRFGVVAARDCATREGVAAALAGTEAVLVLADAAAGGEDADAAKRTMRILLDRDEPPTAVVCGSDGEALAAVRECLMCGVEVPGDISIVGFGDGEFARHAVPSLTTLRISVAALAARGAAALIARLGGELSPPAEVPVKLVVRETTAPPRG